MMPRAHWKRLAQRCVVAASIALLALATPPLHAMQRAAGEGARAAPRGDDRLARTIEAWVRPYTDSLLSGTLLVARGRRVLYERSFGHSNFELRTRFTPATPTNIASITKPLTLIVLERMVAAGLLRHDDTVSRWLPEFRHGRRMTVDHLARHRAGVPHRLLPDERQTEPRTATDMVEFANQMELLFEPGARGSYSSGGFAILAAVLERAGGAPYDALLQRFVGEAAGARTLRHVDARTALAGRASSVMPSASGYLNSPLRDLSFLVGGGSVYATPRDVHAVIATLLSGGYGEPARARLVGANGFQWNGVTGGFRAFADYHARDSLIVLFFGNAYTGAVDVLRRELPRIARGERRPAAPLPPAIRAVALRPEVIARLAGGYDANQGEAALLRAVHPALFTFGSRSLVPVDDSTMYSLADWLFVRFTSDSAGRVSAMQWGAAPGSADSTGPRFPRIATRESSLSTPVFDVHLHAPFTPANARAMLAAMDSLQVHRAVYIGSYEQLLALPDSASGRLIPGLMFPCDGGRMPNAGVQCFPNGTSSFPDTAWLRRQVTSGRIRVFGEIGAQYLGIAPDDPRLEPYWALAEELDVPVGIHLGIGPIGVAYSSSPFPAFKSPAYRGSAGDPQLLEEVLVRHPKLRVYVMHAAWPEIDRMIYMMCMHPQLHVDVSVLQYAISRPAYLAALRTLADAGLTKRIMFGSDGGPRFLAQGIEAIVGASFLTDAQKRDILHDNAMRFFRVGDTTPSPPARTCGA